MVTMRISIDLSGAHRTTAWEYGIRFLLGGMVTAVAGLIADKFGPAAGGLFLAFPAIFPASATLIEKHEINKKQIVGMHGSIRGRQAAALDAAGAAIGSIGLLAFALFVGWFADKHRPSIVLVGATLAWFATADLIWCLRKGHMLKRLKSWLRER
jgi:Protein of unknown function (DUF3147)